MDKPVFEYEPLGPLGYQLLTEDIIECADCGKPLVEIIKVMEGAIKKNVLVKCPFCDGGTSFLFRIEGQTYIQAVDNVIISNMPMDIDDDGVMHITVETMKNG
jgi:phage FluMu protein Com